MDERTKAINLKPLQAFEAMDVQTSNRMLPGFESKEDKDNYRRFSKKAFKQQVPMLYNTMGGADSLERRALLTANESPP